LTLRVRHARMIPLTYPSKPEYTMTNPRRPLRLNVGFLINQPIGVSREFLFDYPEIKAGEDTRLTNFSGSARISRTPQGLLVQAKFEASLTMECVRCLETYQQRLGWEFTELYAFSRRSVTESGLLVPEDAHIDLEPLTRDYALLEVPINPICKENCRGLCPVCGENMNQVDCGHRSGGADSPFAVLKSLTDE